jgi:hypothetical protein
MKRRILLFLLGHIEVITVHGGCIPEVGRRINSITRAKLSALHPPQTDELGTVSQYPGAPTASAFHFVLPYRLTCIVTQRISIPSARGVDPDPPDHVPLISTLPTSELRVPPRHNERPRPSPRTSTKSRA